MPFLLYGGEVITVLIVLSGNFLSSSKASPHFMKLDSIPFSLSSEGRLFRKRKKVETASDSPFLR